MYKQASKERLRFDSHKGLLTTEQLWDLSIEQLNTMAVELDENIEKAKSKSFITTKSSKDKLIKLRFDIVLDVLNTKVAESEAEKNAFEIKQHNQKILQRIQANQEKALDNMTTEELEKLLK